MPPIEARRKDLENATATGATHVGLWLDRFLKHPKQKDGGDAVVRARDELLTHAISQDSSIYHLAYKRWMTSIEPSASKAIASTKDLPVQGRLVSGLGIASPLETGISLHHTYGVPWLPGSGLKGLAARYCATVWGKADPRFLRAVDDKGNVVHLGDSYKALFGTNEESGLLVFHDGWWVPDSSSGLELDVMTPHHGDYYMKEQPTATDFDMPVPVSFLSVKGKFSVAVECPCGVGDEGKAKEWAHLGLKILTEALGYWGFGGKTNAGYGRIGTTERALQTGKSTAAPTLKVTDFTAPDTANGRRITQFATEFKPLADKGRKLEPKRDRPLIDKIRNFVNEQSQWKSNDERACLAGYLRQFGPVLLDDKTWNEFEAKLPKP